MTIHYNSLIKFSPLHEEEFLKQYIFKIDFISYLDYINSIIVVAKLKLIFPIKN